MAGVMAAGLVSVAAWVGGIALLGLWPRLPPPSCFLALCAAGLGLAGGIVVAARRGRGPALLLHIGVLVASTLLAHGSTGLRTQTRLEARLPHALEGVPLILVGVVQDLPRRSPQGVQFSFRVETARSPSGAPVAGVPQRLWLGWWADGHVEALLAAAVPEPKPGERWQLPVSLKRPHGTFNPGGFDAERWFLEQDLGASGSVLAGHRGLVRHMGRAGAGWHQPESWRAALRGRIDAHVQDAALAGLVGGLTIGDQSAVEAADWQLFRAAGLAHALSISGAHITIFAAMAAPLAAWLWRRWPQGCLWCPATLMGAWAGWLLALAYALLAGWGLPAQRTVAMLAVVVLIRALRLNWPVMVVWVAAAAPIVLLDPWSVSQAGFWLSFAAVGLLLLAGAGDARRDPSLEIGEGSRGLSWSAAWAPEGWARAVLGLRALPQSAWRALRTQVITAVGLAPLAAACFGELSVVGVLGNLVALPVITLVLTPLCMLGLLWPAVWSVLPWVVDPLRALMTGMIGWPGAVVAVPGSGAIPLALALAGVVLALMRLPVRWRLGGLALMMPLLMPPPRLPAPGHLEVWALDVGQGSAVLVRTRHHALLLDAGPSWGEGRDAGERVVLPALRHLGVRRIDEFVVTHRDLDHVGGAATVIKGLPVMRLRTSLESSHPLLRMAVPHEPCRRGQSWQWDGVQFQVLHPFGDEGPKVKPNFVSCVVRVEDGQGRSLLLTGDIEREQEQALVRAAEDASGLVLGADALVVPHHGSRTSSTEPFLRSVQPRWALAQAGYRNRYGHPSASVVQRYGQLGIPLLSSPGCGALLWRGAEPQCWRQLQPRHWHDEPADIASPARVPLVGR